MLKNHIRLHIGLRTIKTAAAVIISMVIVDLFGTTPSKLIFAMLGAMAAVQPTFQESVESCLTQIIGVLFGALAGIALMALPIPSLAATGIGIVLVITLYNALHIRFSPSLPCFIVVMLCTSSDIEPVGYALGRIWDSTIGLSVGMLINTLVFPYDNSRQIRATIESLDHTLIHFLEDMYDGDDVLPDAEEMTHKIDSMALQLDIFSRQRLFLRLGRQQRQLQVFRACEWKARQLVAHMEVLCRMTQPGRLNQDNRNQLEALGAEIRDVRLAEDTVPNDIISNYHVLQILTLRQELREALEK